MNVLHLSTSDVGGGAARAAHRLHKGLRHAGISSRMLVKNKLGEDDAVEEYAPPSGLWTRLKRRWRREKIQRAFRRYRSTRPEGLEPFSDDRSRYRGRVLEQCPPTAVLNLHWVAEFVDVTAFFENTTTPVVWTLHDMNPFTGGCHYNVDCRRYRNSCGRCPQLGSSEENDLSHAVWTRKRRVYDEAIRNQRLQIVTPSEWLARGAEKSSLFSEAEVQVIPYGIDQKTFRPRETQGLRASLDIPADHRVILFVAHSTENHRKGFDLLAGAIESLTVERVTLLSIGATTPELNAACPHLHLGMLESDVLLSVLYSFADLFVIPSRQDNLPNTVLESMACGTPVVGFNVGGIPDMVRSGETGWLAEVGSVRALRQALDTALRDDEARRRMGKRCREVVEEEYALEVQARRYRDLYRQMVGEAPDALG